MITPFDDFIYLVNNVLLGDEPVSTTNKVFKKWLLYTKRLENVLVCKNYIKKVLFLDDRRLHTAHRHCCCFCGICAMVLFSCHSEGDSDSDAL